jgi:hypothetical protein
MSSDDKYDKNKVIKTDEDDSGRGEGGKGGKGGQSGQVEFKAFISLGETRRDDLMPPDERRRLLGTHKETHEGRVKKQKELMDQRHAVKEGKVPLQAYREGLMQNSGMGSQYKANPILANKAQFSGIDRQVNSLPNENVADTNPAEKNELRMNFDLQHRPEYVPQFNPKPLHR